MNISSYNVTDVGYHYIGLRALAGLPSTALREEQTSAVSRSVLKYATDKALRLMLPAPRGNFEAVGEKICQELVHFDLAHSAYGRGYELTSSGKSILELLNTRQHALLRRRMIELHLKTYDNLREVVQKHMDLKSILSPVVDAATFSDMDYVVRLLQPTFGEQAEKIANVVIAEGGGSTAKKMEDVLRSHILRHIFPAMTMSVALFRSICDRLVSLRLLNLMRYTAHECEFAKSYSPCRATPSEKGWYTGLNVHTSSSGLYSIYLPEPDFTNASVQTKFLQSLDSVFSILPQKAGYYDLPDVRDCLCEQLMIPEMAFDDGVNQLLDLPTSPITVGLMYEKISARRRPLVRTRDNTQIFNLIRRI